MKFLKYCPLLLLTLLIGWPLLLQADESKRLTAQSPPHTVALLELYTSEG